MRLLPPFVSCLRYAARVLGSAFAVICVVSLVGDIMNGVPPLNNIREHPIEVILVSVSLVCGLAAISYLLLWFLSWHISNEGVVGRDSSGRRVRFKWEEISHIRVAHGVPFPAINISGSGAEREIQAYVMGLNFKRVHAMLLACAGADNPLTVAFRSDG